MMMEPLVIQNLEILDTVPSGGGAKKSGDKGDNNGNLRKNGEILTTRDAYDSVKGITSPRAEKSQGQSQPQVEEEEEEGVTIVVGDNDSVSSLDSSDSFALSDDEEVVEMEKPPSESFDSPIRRHMNRHQPKGHGGTGPRLRELSPLFRRSKRQIQPRRKPRRHERFNPRGMVPTGPPGQRGSLKPPPRVRASSLDTHFFQNSSAAAAKAAANCPMPPQRKRTNEDIKRPSKPYRLRGSNNTRGAPPPVFVRNHSSPELLSPGKNKRGKSPPQNNNSQSKDQTSTPENNNNNNKQQHNTTPREAMADSKQRGVQRNSSRSLNCLEALRDEQEFQNLLDDDSEDEEDDDDHHYNHHHHHRHNNNHLNNSTSSSRWQHHGDNESTANTQANASRWSASTGTGASRSLNTTQLEQLSTVPRFPRRQKTGEDLKELRRSQHSTATTPESIKSNNNNQEIEPGGVEGGGEGGGGTPTSTSGDQQQQTQTEPQLKHTTSIGSNSTPTHPKKRPQLPNRQKSFRRNVMTMNQVAQAIHQNQNSANTGGYYYDGGGEQQLSPLQKPPIMPRRTTSADTTLTNGSSMTKQRSLPNLYSDGSRKGNNKKPYSIENLSLSLSNHSTTSNNAAGNHDLEQQPTLTTATTTTTNNDMDASTPRLPERKKSSYENPMMSLGTGSSHHSRQSSHSRIRRVRSEGATRTIGKMMMFEQQQQHQQHPSHGPGGGDEFSATTNSSSGLIMMGLSNMPDESESTNFSISQTTLTGGEQSGGSMMMPSKMMNNNSNDTHESSARSRISNFNDSMGSCGSPKMPRRQISHDTTASGNSDGAVAAGAAMTASAGVHNSHHIMNKRLSKSRIQIESTIQETLENSFSVFDDDDANDGDDDDKDESESSSDDNSSAAKGRNSLPHHLLAAASSAASMRQSVVGLDSSARLPLRQLSLSEHGDGDEETNIFKTAATLLGQEFGDDDDSEGQEEDVGSGFDSSARLPLRQLSHSEHDVGGGDDGGNIFKTASTLLGKEAEEIEGDIDDEEDEQIFVSKGESQGSTVDEKKKTANLKESESQVEEEDKERN